MMAAKKLARVLKQCVACGCCVKECAFEAIGVNNGVAALVDEGKCKGCGKCQKVCPAGVIEMVQREGAGA